MNIPVDTHVILLPETNQEYWKMCHESLKNEPINLHLIEGTNGHIGTGRSDGFSKGSSPYVCCIDPDDIVIPGAFISCIKALETHPEACGAYTDELVIDESGRTVRKGLWSGREWNPLLQIEPQYLHHIFVMRREFVDQHMDELRQWPFLADFILKGLLTAHGPWIHVNGFGYKWRLHQNQAHKKYPRTGLNAARWRIIPTLREAAYRYKAKLPIDTGD